MVFSYSRSETMELTAEYVGLLWERKGVAEGEGNYLVGDGAVGGVFVPGLTEGAGPRDTGKTLFNQCVDTLREDRSVQ